MAAGAATQAPLPVHRFDPGAFTDDYCSKCHDEVSKKGSLDLTSLEFQPGDPNNFDAWVKVHDRLEAQEMPPKKEKNQ